MYIFMPDLPQDFLKPLGWGTELLGYSESAPFDSKHRFKVPTPNPAWILHLNQYWLALCQFGAS